MDDFIHPNIFSLSAALKFFHIVGSESYNMCQYLSSIFCSKIISGVNIDPDSGAASDLDTWKEVVVGGGIVFFCEYFILPSTDTEVDMPVNAVTRERISCWVGADRVVVKPPTPDKGSVNKPCMISMCYKNVYNKKQNGTRNYYANITVYYALSYK